MEAWKILDLANIVTEIHRWRLKNELWPVSTFLYLKQLFRSGFQFVKLIIIPAIQVVVATTICRLLAMWILEQSNQELWCYFARNMASWNCRNVIPPPWVTLPVDKTVAKEGKAYCLNYFILHIWAYFEDLYSTLGLPYPYLYWNF